MRKLQQSPQIEVDNISENTNDELDKQIENFNHFDQVRATTIEKMRTILEEAGIKIFIDEQQEDPRKMEDSRLTSKVIQNLVSGDFNGKFNLLKIDGELNDEIIREIDANFKDYLTAKTELRNTTNVRSREQTEKTGFEPEGFFGDTNFDSQTERLEFFTEKYLEQIEIITQKIIPRVLEVTKNTSSFLEMRKEIFSLPEIKKLSVLQQQQIEKKLKAYSRLLDTKKQLKGKLSDEEMAEFFASGRVIEGSSPFKDKVTVKENEFYDVFSLEDHHDFSVMIEDSKDYEEKWGVMGVANYAPGAPYIAIPKELMIPEVEDHEIRHGRNKFVMLPESAPRSAEGRHLDKIKDEIIAYLRGYDSLEMTKLFLKRRTYYEAFKEKITYKQWCDLIDSFCDKVGQCDKVDLDVLAITPLKRWGLVLQNMERFTKGRNSSEIIEVKKMKPGEENLETITGLASKLSEECLQGQKTIEDVFNEYILKSKEAGVSSLNKREREFFWRAFRNSIVNAERQDLYLDFVEKIIPGLFEEFDVEKINDIQMLLYWTRDFGIYKPFLDKFFADVPLENPIVKTVLDDILVSEKWKSEYCETTDVNNKKVRLKTFEDKIRFLKNTLKQINK